MAGREHQAQDVVVERVGEPAISRADSIRQTASIVRLTSAAATP
jgi:hypothetical protein